MRDINLTKTKLPYMAFCAAKPTHRKLSLAQQRVLDQMGNGVWYEPSIHGEWRTCIALFRGGYCDCAQIAARNDDGTLRELSSDEKSSILLLAITGEFDQPYTVFRVNQTSSDKNKTND